MSTEHFIDRLRLNEAEQQALAASHLRLMDADLAVSGDRERKRVRDEFFDSLRAGPLGHRAIEDPLVFRDLVQPCKDTPRCLAMLVELCAAHPFAEVRRELNAEEREGCLAAIARDLGGYVDGDDIERIDEYGDEARRAAQWRPRPWVFAAIAGIAGIPSAAIAAAVAYPIAAAVAHRPVSDAELAGRSSREGLAGGTAALVLIDGSALKSIADDPKDVGVQIVYEAIKLFSLVRCFDDYAADPYADAPEDVSFERLASAGRRALRELKRSLNDGPAAVEPELKTACEKVSRLVKELERVKSE